MTICPQCGATNKENSNFCEVCGEPLKTTQKLCPECGTENVEIANFCENCGTSLEMIKSNMKSLKTKYIENPDFLENNSKDNSSKISLNLTPAESLILLNHEGNYGQGTTSGELLKVTLIDLVFKNVFKIDVREVEKKGIFGTKTVKKTYLQEGKNFNMPLKPHEEVFRRYLPSKADSKRLRILQQRVRKAYGRRYGWKTILDPLALEGYFNVEKKFLGKKYTLSAKGIEARDMIVKLKEEGKYLDRWIDTDPERAKAYLMMGGTNVFLTDDYYFEWFKNNSKKIAALFASAAVVGTAYTFSRFRWYGTFKHHGDMDFDNFGDFGDFNDFTGDNIEDIFSDSDVFDTFDSMDFSDFDSGFDSGGFDGGDFGGDGGGGE